MKRADVVDRPADCFGQLRVQRGKGCVKFGSAGFERIGPQPHSAVKRCTVARQCHIAFGAHSGDDRAHRVKKAGEIGRGALQQGVTFHARQAYKFNNRHSRHLLTP